MKEKKLTSKNVLFNKIQLEKADLLINEQGFNSFTAIIHRGLDEVYDKYYKSYGGGNTRILGLKSTTNDDIVKTKAKMKVDAKLAEKKYEEDKKVEKKVLICTNILGGSVEDGDHGKVCKWTTYNANGKDGEQQVPLSQVHEILATNNLFFPNREAVMKTRPELIKKFNFK